MQSDKIRSLFFGWYWIGTSLPAIVSGLFVSCDFSQVSKCYLCVCWENRIDQKLKWCRARGGLSLTVNVWQGVSPLWEWTNQLGHGFHLKQPPCQSQSHTHLIQQKRAYVITSYTGCSWVKQGRMDVLSKKKGTELSVLLRPHMLYPSVSHCQHWKKKTHPKM